jgi:hypothetical protein
MLNDARVFILKKIKKNYTRMHIRYCTSSTWKPEEHMKNNHQKNMYRCAMLYCFNTSLQTSCVVMVD